MKRFLPGESERYLESLGISPHWPHSFVQRTKDSATATFFLPQNCVRRIALCQTLLERLELSVCVYSAINSCMAEVGSLDRVYESYVRAIGLNSNDSSPILFDEDERKLVGDLLAMAAISGWDASVVSPTSKRIVNFCHHETLQLIALTGAEITQMTSSLELFDLVPASSLWV